MLGSDTMYNQKIMIKLINEIDNIISDIYDLDDLLLPETVENLNEFSRKIDEILFEQLKDTLKSDPYKFIKSSDIIKQNKKIIELVTSIDSRLNAYAK